MRRSFELRTLLGGAAVAAVLAFTPAGVITVRADEEVPVSRASQPLAGPACRANAASPRPVDFSSALAFGRRVAAARGERSDVVPLGGRGYSDAVSVGSDPPPEREVAPPASR